MATNATMANVNAVKNLDFTCIVVLVLFKLQISPFFLT